MRNGKGFRYGEFWYDGIAMVASLDVTNGLTRLGESLVVKWRITRYHVENHSLSHGESLAVTWRIARCQVENRSISRGTMPNITWNNSLDIIRTISLHLTDGQTEHHRIASLKTRFHGREKPSGILGLSLNGGTRPPLRMRKISRRRRRDPSRDRYGSTGSTRVPVPSSQPQILALPSRTDPACCARRVSRFQKWDACAHQQQPRTLHLLRHRPHPYA